MSGNRQITGKVSTVVDGEKVCIEIGGIGKKARRNRNGRELIRIRRIKLDDVVWVTGVFTKALLEKLVGGRDVTCKITSRDDTGTIVADVHLAGQAT